MRTNVNTCPQGGLVCVRSELLSLRHTRENSAEKIGGDRSGPRPSVKQIALVLGATFLSPSRALSHHFLWPCFFPSSICVLFYHLLLLVGSPPKKKTENRISMKAQT